MINIDAIEPKKYSDPELVLWSDWYRTLEAKLFSLPNIVEVKSTANKIQIQLLYAVINKHIGLSTYCLGLLIIDAYLRGWYNLATGCLCVVNDCETGCHKFDACNRYNAWLILTPNTKPKQRLRVFWDIFIPGVPFDAV